MSAITSEPPRYGTCVASTPAASRNFSAEICTALPMPAEPNEIDPGLALASAIKSCTVFQGRALGATITLALEPIINTAARSFVVSNDKLGNSAGAIVNAEEWAKML